MADEVIHTGCGEQKANPKRILVVYASRFGSTAKVAEGIAEELCRAGSQADTRWVNETVDVSQYDAVVVGGAINYDRWMKDATEFVERNQAVLATVPVAYFFTCLTLTKTTDKALAQAAGYGEKIRLTAAGVTPIAVGQFAGVLDYSKMSFMTRQVAKGLMKVLGVKEGDYRDWRQIRQWASEIHPGLRGQA